MSSDGQKTLDGWLSRNAAPSGSAVGTKPSTSTPTSTPTTVKPPEQKDENPRGSSSQRAALTAIAAETRTVLPDILSKLPNIHASKAEALFLSTLPALKQADCPGYPGTAIRIMNEDSFNVAISLASSVPPVSPSPTATPSPPPTARVAVLNMASHSSPGGGWLRGALAQEEALCYRSSLALSLHRRFYPWKQRMGLYTPDVVVIRSDMPSGHKLLLPDVSVADLPVVSMLSIAALRGPETTTVRQVTAAGVQERKTYAKPGDRALTKDKMRLCLRMAAQRGHGRLVLGALGCGAFRNPKEEVAKCWLEVFQESEFQGGWWEAVWFAVYDRRNEGNFEVFEDVLGGVQV